MSYKKFRINLFLSLALLCLSIFTMGGGSCTPNEDCRERARKKGTFNLCGLLKSNNEESFTGDNCYSFDEIELSECPALEILAACEPYLCEGCTSEFCVDFLFPKAFVGCEAIDCNTLDCDGLYGIEVNGYPRWETLIENEVVQINCHSNYLLVQD